MDQWITRVIDEDSDVLGKEQRMRRRRRALESIGERIKMNMVIDLTCANKILLENLVRGHIFITEIYELKSGIQKDGCLFMHLIKNFVSTLTV